MSARRRLRRIGRALTTPLALLSIAASLLALLVWFLGPLVAVGEARPLEGVSVRLAILLALALLWGIGGLLLHRVRSAEEQAMLAALRRQRDEDEAARERDAAAIEADVDAFRTRLSDTLRLLRRADPGGWLRRGRRYALPWYLVLGSEGAGKTAALLRGGLTLSTELPSGGAGAGFLIGEEAVAVEMPGRYLDQSGSPQDAQVWRRMLAALRRLRPYQPVNGVVVVLDAAPLALAGAEEVQQGALLLRRRLDEISATLRTRPPVYLVVAKLDAIAGFEAFFETLSAMERQRLLAVPLAPTGDGQDFTAGFDMLARSLRARQLQRLQEEPDAQRRLRLYEFPAQFAVLGSALAPLVRVLLAPRRWDPVPLLRGVFFGSAQQSGLAADALAAPMAPVFAQAPAVLALAHEPDLPRGRSYFLAPLLPEALLPDAPDGGRSTRALNLGRLQRTAAVLLLCALAGALAWGWWQGVDDGRAHIAAVAAHAEEVRRELVLATASDGERPLHFAPVLEVLDELRALDTVAAPDAPFGLYRPATLEDSAHAAYVRGLQALLAPFVQRYLEAGLADADTPPGLTLQQLKLYLMLGGRHAGEPAAAEAIAEDFRRVWLPDDARAPTAARIARHLQALLAEPADPPAAVDAALVAGARRRVVDASLARLAYDRLRALPQVQALPDWRPAEHMSAAGPRALARLSGDSLFDGIPGLYTRAGFLGTMRPLTDDAARALGQDLWAMGVPQDAASVAAGTLRIRDGVLDLYRADFIRHWDSLVADLTVRPAEDADAAADVLAVLVGPPSPVLELTGAIAEETDLAAAQAAEDAAAEKPPALPPGVAVPAVPPVAKAAAGAALAALQGPSPDMPKQRLKDMAQAVSDRFLPLRQAVGTAAAPGPLAAAITALTPLYSQLNRAAAGGTDAATADAAAQALSQLSEATGRLPQALQPLLRRVGAQAGAIAGGLSRARLAEIWNGTGAQLCVAAVRGRYPFDAASAKDASLADFALLFGPAGSFAGFQNDYLKPFVDSSSHPWRWKTGGQPSLGLDDSVLAAFERAADIRAAFFAEGDVPKFAFTAQLMTLDPLARAAQLDLGGPVLLFTHGPAEPKPSGWSGGPESASATVSVSPELEGERNAIRRTGPWALFHLLDDATRTATDTPEAIDARFALGSRAVTLRLRAAQAVNPLTHPLLAGFQCPRL